MIHRKLEMSRFSKRGTLLAVALSLAWTTSAWARPPGPDGQEPGPGGFPDQLLEKVGVDQSRREEIASISKRSQVRAGELHEQIHIGRENLRSLLEQDAPDSDLVMKKVEEIGALETEASKHRLTTMLSIRALLTPEQRTELSQLHEAHRDRRFERKMGGIERACRDTLEETCSEAEGRHERMKCLRDQHPDISEPCRMAMRRMHRPRHPRFDSRPPEPPPGD